MKPINLSAYELESNVYLIPNIFLREKSSFTQPDQDVESEGDLVLDGEIIGSYIMTDKGPNIIGDFKLTTDPSTITHHVQEFSTNQSVNTMELKIFMNENNEWDADVTEFTTGVKNSSIDRMKNEDKKIDRPKFDTDTSEELEDHVINAIESVTI